MSQSVECYLLLIGAGVDVTLAPCKTVAGKGAAPGKDEHILVSFKKSISLGKRNSFDGE